MSEFIFGVFENSKQDLSYLEEEKSTFKEVFDELRRNENSNIQLEISADTELEHVIAQITKFKYRITVFHLACHHGTDYFPMKDKQFLDKSLIYLLNSCPRLKLVFINGCETETIAKALVNVPFIIGTKIPIRDEIAYSFAKGFYNSIAGRLQNPEAYANSYKHALGVCLGGHANAHDGENVRAILVRGGSKEIEEIYHLWHNDSIQDFSARFYSVNNYPINELIEEAIALTGIDDRLDIGCYFAKYPYVFNPILEKISKLNKEQLSIDRYECIAKLFFTLQTFIKYCGVSVFWEYLEGYSQQNGINNLAKLAGKIKEQLHYTSISKKNCHDKQLFIFELFQLLDQLNVERIFIKDCCSFLQKHREKLEALSEFFEDTIDNIDEDQGKLIEAEQFIYLFIKEANFLMNYRFSSVIDNKFFKSKKNGKKYESKIRFVKQDTTFKYGTIDSDSYDVYAVHLVHISKNGNTTQVSPNHDEKINLAPFYIDKNIEEAVRKEIATKSDLHCILKYYEESNDLKYYKLNEVNSDLLLSHDNAFSIRVNNGTSLHSDYLIDLNTESRIKMQFDALIKTLESWIQKQ